MKKGDAAPDPIRQILEDITSLIGGWLPQGFHPIVMGDFNSDIHEKEMQFFVTTNNLVDLIANTNEGTPPATYSRGHRRLDFIFGTQYTLRAVVQSCSLGLHNGDIRSYNAVA